MPVLATLNDLALIISKRVKIIPNKITEAVIVLLNFCFRSVPTGVSMHCVREEHSAVNMNLHYLENGTVMLNFIYQKELFFLPLGFALKV